jgi:hypothetical protein
LDDEALHVLEDRALTDQALGVAGLAAQQIGSRSRYR